MVHSAAICCVRRWISQLVMPAVLGKHNRKDCWGYWCSYSGMICCCRLQTSPAGRRLGRRRRQHRRLRREEAGCRDAGVRLRCCDDEQQRHQQRRRGRGPPATAPPPLQFPPPCFIIICVVLECCVFLVRVLLMAENLSVCVYVVAVHYSLLYR